jgi:hypothetical protein
MKEVTQTPLGMTYAALIEHALNSEEASVNPENTHTYNQSASVNCYTPQQKTLLQGYKTVSVFLSFDKSSSGETSKCVVNHTIHIPHLERVVACPMQFRSNAIKVNYTHVF